MVGAPASGKGHSELRVIQSLGLSGILCSSKGGLLTVQDTLEARNGSQPIPGAEDFWRRNGEVSGHTFKSL